VSWASQMLIFSLLRPSALDLGSATDETDRQTDRGNVHHCIICTYHMGGIKIKEYNYSDAVYFLPFNFELQNLPQTYQLIKVAC